MSAPTLYKIRGNNGDVLGSMRTKIFSWFHVSRSQNEAEFFNEVGELIVTDLIPYCKGQQAGEEPPTFKLSDVATIESSGGEVQAAEFVLCVQAYLKNMAQSIKCCQNEKTKALEKGDAGQAKVQELDETISYFNEAQKNAHDAIAFLKETFPAAPLNKKQEIDAAVNRGISFLQQNPDKEIVLQLSLGRGQKLQWKTARAKDGDQISLDFLRAVKGGEDEMISEVLGASIQRIFTKAHQDPTISFQMEIDPRPDCEIQQVALLPPKAPC